MNPLRLLVLLTLFLSVVCNAQDLGKDLGELQDRGVNGYFEINAEEGYTGKVFSKHQNGQIDYKGQLKKGKFDGLLRQWHPNGEKASEVNYKDGNIVEGSEKYWNSKGVRVDSREEALKE